MKRFVKMLFLAVFVAAVVGAFIYAFQPRPVELDTAEIIIGPMHVTIDEEGETRLRERFVVSAPVAGRILRIDLEPGDRVLAGRTVIATFRPTEPAFLDTRAQAEAGARVRAAEAAIGRARANRDRVREQSEFAESQRLRYEELFEQGLVSRERLDTAVFEARTQREALNTAEFEVGDAEQAVEVARASLVQTSDDAVRSGSGSPITIRAPIDGVVLRRLRESESVVPAGEPLVELGDTTQIEIVSDLLSEDAVQVRRGNKVLIEQWGGGMTLQGLVRLVEPSGFTKLSALGVEEQRVNVVIDFEDAREASQYLGDGYRVEVRVVIWETDSTLRAPTSSLFRTGEDWMVYAVSEATAQLTVVEVGHRNATEAEILSGLSAGDTVIVHPADDIDDGVRVSVRGTN